MNYTQVKENFKMRGHANTKKTALPAHLYNDTYKSKTSYQAAIRNMYSFSSVYILRFTAETIA